MQKVTPQAKLLYGALRKRKIKCVMEAYDGYKHVDISIPSAKIDIEVDGLQHYIDPMQILSDFNREHYSDRKDNYNTIHIPNLIIEHHINEVADAIAIAAKMQIKIIEKSRKDRAVRELLTR